MPSWYGAIITARYARMPAPEFVALPIWWQDAYETARVAEIEASQSEVVTE